MKRILTAVVLIPLVLLIVFKAPLWLFALAVAGIIVVGLHEYLGIAETAGVKPFHKLTYAVSVALLILISVLSQPRSGSAQFHITALMWMPALLAPLIFGIPLVFRKDLASGMASVAVSIFGVFYIAGSLALLVSLRSDVHLRVLVVFTLFSVWAGDIAAYYVGRSIGRHKLAPVVSPNKSWEGAIASVMASMLVALLTFHFQFSIAVWLNSGMWDGVAAGQPPSEPYGLTPIAAALLGLLTNIAAQFGDLFESALKRGAGVKDSGTLLPGHGGILDRIDALLFAIPVVCYFSFFMRT
ncbi:MAG TPA: phosphatidate cytidylyltransferase, partial [Candidatus Limnocylindrales bacterium]|nr:phosphatidate cytidylyltransferase [Candidatus Limnocylindrales bacterium]